MRYQILRGRIEIFPPQFSQVFFDDLTAHSFGTETSIDLEVAIQGQLRFFDKIYFFMTKLFSVLYVKKLLTTVDHLSPPNLGYSLVNRITSDEYIFDLCKMYKDN
jgi:hypothetical protein